MGSELSCCPHEQYVLGRLRQLYERRSQDVILAKMNVPSPALSEFARTHSSGFCEYPDIEDRLAFWVARARERVEIHDDSVPSAYLSEMDQGLYGGMFGGDVRFLCDAGAGWISSMVPPLLADWSEFDALSFDRECVWYRRYAAQLRAFVDSAEGKYGISHLILINHLNFAFEFVGATQTYMALYEQPDRVRQATSLAHDVNLCVQRHFFETVPLLDGGTCGDTVQWVPGRIISESVDPFHMTSVDCFEEWGRAPIDRMFAEFDGGIVHIHGNGRHLLPAVASLNGLKAIMLADDRGYPRSFDILSEVRRHVGNMPLTCPVAFRDFDRALKERTLIGGVLYDVTHVPDGDTANRCMDAVRKYRF